MIAPEGQADQAGSERPSDVTRHGVQASTTAPTVMSDFFGEIRPLEVPSQAA